MKNQPLTCIKLIFIKGVIYQVQQLINMPVLPPCMLPSTSDYHILNLPSVPNTSTVTTIPVSISSISNTSNVNNNLSGLSNFSVSNNSTSNKNDSNVTGNGDNASTNTTSRDGDTFNTVNGDMINDSSSSQLVTSVQCNTMLTSQKPNLPASVPAANGSIPCMSKSQL